jgi:hypothetical protein
VQDDPCRMISRPTSVFTCVQPTGALRIRNDATTRFSTSRTPIIRGFACGVRHRVATSPTWTSSQQHGLR